MTDRDPAPTDLPSPSWRWDESAHVLRPCCPACGKPLVMSGRSLTCLLMGFSHFHERAELVVDQALGRLA